MITGVNRKERSDPALAGLLSSIGMPYPTTDVHISRVVGQLPLLIEEHDETVRKLEKVLAKWLKGASKVPEKRPTMRLGGFMGLGGRTVDAVDYLTDRINKLEAAVDECRERIAEKKPESYGFASMATVPFAHAAAKSLKGKHPRGITIALAPPPRDILWQNLKLTKAQRFKSSAWGFVILSVILFINAVPLVAVALISQMSRFTGVLPFLQSWENASQYSFSAVAGLAPPAISGLFGYFLPPIMRRIGKYRGVTTRNKLDRVITSQYFGFLVISQFIVFTLVGVAVTTIAQIVEEIQKHESAESIFGYLRTIVLGTVKYQYLSMANYWLTWIPLRLFVVTFDMSQALKLILTWFQSAFLGRTPRDIREFTKPPSFDYAVYYATMLFIFAVGMLYATLAPLVLAFTAVLLWGSCYLYKYIHLYVAVTKNESGGRLWRVVVNRLLVCIVFMQLILALAVALEEHWEAFACLPPVLIVLGFKFYCMRVFDRRYDWYIPDANEMSRLKTHTGDASHHRLARRFGHTSLHQKLFTPMVHAKVKHLLPEVYHGRLENTGLHDVEGIKADVEEVTGGLKIAAVEEQDCQYDPKTDTDAASIFSSTTVGPFRPGPPSRAGTYDPNFQAQYGQYMAAGPMGANRSVDAFEMSALPLSSQENLLEKSYQSGGPRGMGHGRKGSTATQLSGSPVAEYPSDLYRPSTRGTTGPGGYFPGPPPPAPNFYGAPAAPQGDMGYSGHLRNGSNPNSRGASPGPQRPFLGGPSPPRQPSPGNSSVIGSSVSQRQGAGGYTPHYTDSPESQSQAMFAPPAHYGASDSASAIYADASSMYQAQPPQQQQQPYNASRAYAPPPPQQQRPSQGPPAYPPHQRGGSGYQY